MNILIEDKTAVLPVKKYGGTERVIWGLGKELAKMGHKVYFLAKKGSHSDFATVINFDETKDIKDQIPQEIDVVHLFHSSGKNLDKPYLFTMEGNPPPNQVLDNNMVFVSKNHANRYGSNSYVYNGIDWDDYPDPILDGERKYLHFLAKASWKIKNLFGATKIALKSGEKLHVMGGDRLTYRNIKRGLKYILNPNIIFLGMVENDVKMKVAQNSKALVFPVIWHEPFGIAITESMYAGCAVFGTKNGSLKELITPEVGFTGSNSDEIAKAIREFDYNPRRCHEYAVKYFNSKVMTESYLKLYKKVMQGEKLNPENPKYIASKNTVPEFN
ncbi:glycosyltransferase [Aquimarina sp. MMG016]|uniref:glycosyltransferase n=1 Tax=Aquimarina sp. MMG016 TaxID=2822690 RepID=UPI001B3A467C|nr:glycosyltransferase [Aquimarina sp. MMG016]MBQ4820249.1 glycosyltransferase [Aquimarina sp. MMG016]